MRNFNYSNLLHQKWNLDIIGYSAQIHELKGRQEVYLDLLNCNLEKLKEISTLKSIEASNAIEDINISQLKLKQIVSDNLFPKTRDEKAIAGYKDALNYISESYSLIELTSELILKLHQMLFSYLNISFAGKYKEKQNYIVSGKSGIFTPLAPYETKEAIEKICLEYNIALSKGVEPLILIPTFIHDFLCIHPFLDGNGRMSRLLTTLLLYKAGFNAGKYISLEAKINEHKDLYYSSLSFAQIGWHDNKEDKIPFIKYILGCIISSYRDAETRLSLISKRLPADALVRKAIEENIIGKFTKSDVISLCPTLSVKAIKSSLKKMLDEDKLLKHGDGKSTFYTRK